MTEDINSAVRELARTTGILPRMREILVDDMSDDLKQQYIACKTIPECKAVLAKFAKIQKDNGRPYPHP